MVQDLITLTSIKFFSLDDVRLGTKDLMIEELYKITGTSILAL
jgi:hypothetical protein